MDFQQYFALEALRVPRDARFVLSAVEAQAQTEHYQRISALGHDRGLCLNEERFSSAVLRDLVEILRRLETTTALSATKLRHTAERSIGRDQDLARRDAAWSDSHKNDVIVRASGGRGKTSLVATWMAELAMENWRGADRVFDWPPRHQRLTRRLGRPFHRRSAGGLWRHRPHAGF